jgi:hypothetical protein
MSWKLNMVADLGGGYAVGELQFSARFAGIKIRAVIVCGQEDSS